MGVLVETDCAGAIGTGCVGGATEDSTTEIGVGASVGCSMISVFNKVPLRFIGRDGTSST